MRRKGLNCLGEHRDIVLGKANIGWPVAMTIASKCTDEDLDPHTMIFFDTVNEHFTISKIADSFSLFMEGLYDSTYI